MFSPAAADMANQGLATRSEVSPTAAGSGGASTPAERARQLTLLLAEQLSLHESHLSKVLNLEGRESALEQQLVAAKARRSRLEKESLEAKDAAIQVAQLQQRKDDCMQQFNTFIADLDTLRQKIDEGNNELATESERLSALEQTSAEIQNKVAAMEVALAKLSLRPNATSRQLMALNTWIDSLSVYGNRVATKLMGSTHVLKLNRHEAALITQYAGQVEKCIEDLCFQALKGLNPHNHYNFYERLALDVARIASAHSLDFQSLSHTENLLLKVQRVAPAAVACLFALCLPALLARPVGKGQKAAEALVALALFSMCALAVVHAMRASVAQRRNTMGVANNLLKAAVGQAVASAGRELGLPRRDVSSADARVITRALGLLGPGPDNFADLLKAVGALGADLLEEEYQDHVVKLLEPFGCASVDAFNNDHQIFKVEVEGAKASVRSLSEQLRAKRSLLKTLGQELQRGERSLTHGAMKQLQDEIRRIESRLEAIGRYNPPTDEELQAAETEIAAIERQRTLLREEKAGLERSTRLKDTSLQIMAESAYMTEAEYAAMKNHIRVRLGWTNEKFDNMWNRHVGLKKGAIVRRARGEEFIGSLGNRVLPNPDAAIHQATTYWNGVCALYALTQVLSYMDGGQYNPPPAGNTETQATYVLDHEVPLGLSADQQGRVLTTASSTEVRINYTPDGESKVVHITPVPSVKEIDMTQIMPPPLTEQKLLPARQA
ncbi:MAG TPA: hypothetical protein VFV39_11510 [Limnobacter sp.]|nr:hypothetical protein [Limnobacter sp.]